MQQVCCLWGLNTHSRDKFNRCEWSFLWRRQDLVEKVNHLSILTFYLHFTRSSVTTLLNHISFPCPSVVPKSPSASRVQKIHGKIFKMYLFTWPKQPNQALSIVFIILQSTKSLPGWTEPLQIVLHFLKKIELNTWKCFSKAIIIIPPVTQREAVAGRVK